MRGGRLLSVNPMRGGRGQASVELLAMVPLIALAVVFSLAYERTGKIGTTMVAHALFNLNASVLVLFPRMASTQSRRTVYLATGLTAAVGVVITVISLLLGNVVIRILGGAQYAHLGSEAEDRAPLGRAERGLA